MSGRLCTTTREPAGGFDWAHTAGLNEIVRTPKRTLTPANGLNVISIIFSGVSDAVLSHE